MSGNPVRVRTSAGWQDLALVGPQGPPGATGPQGEPGILADAPVNTLTYGRKGGAWVRTVDVGGDTMTGALSVTADITTYRLSDLATGAVFFGNSGSKYLYYNGAVFSLSANLGVPAITTGVITSTAANSAIALRKPSHVNSNEIRGYTGNAETGLRWMMELGNGLPEGGSNAGSAFALHRYNDIGQYLDSPITIGRQDGRAFFINAVHCSDPNGGFITHNPGAANTVYLVSGTPNSVGNSVFTQANFTPGVSNAYRVLVYSGAPVGVLELQHTGALIINGQGWKPGGGVWADTSDARIKNVTSDYTRGLAEVSQLRPVHYTFKGNDTVEPPGYVKGDPNIVTPKDAPNVPYPNSLHYQTAVEQVQYTGLVAQEVEAVMPEMVKQRAGYIDGVQVSDIRDLDTAPLIFALINAIKELKARVEQLEQA